ncbi:WecB/TagA/CpsF family glycosyltransferase [Paenarthrobacter sp. NPDC092416]|uniref:WecB/TagA/CpsF family glycosyltransferase n=1 Tax=Paenarthrobacter sp. NPDC092416 TaxID=3364386 RepID=UPI00382DDD22
MDKVKFAGVPFSSSTPDQAVDIIIGRVRAGGPAADIHFLNAYSIALAETDSSFRKCVSESALNFPDGKPISVLHRRLHQVRGPGLFEAVMSRGRDVGLRHYLLGSTDETLRKLQLSLEARYPGVQIVGSFSPPFRNMSSEELDAQDDQIRASGAEIVWVGLGTPKQDYEAARLASVGIMSAAVGAAFDFSAGTKPVSPRWVTAIGFEWLHRLLSEPRRLWKRYAWGNVVFLYAATRNSLSR